ncbi:MAG: hypothetical protein GY834_16375 [Bacteroidetes bacterium]|nr:hypothetical protein [Bacteroidota bacterium]
MSINLSKDIYDSYTMSEYEISFQKTVELFYKLFNSPEKVLKYIYNKFNEKAPYNDESVRFNLTNDIWGDYGHDIDEKVFLIFNYYSDENRLSKFCDMKLLESWLLEESKYTLKIIIQSVLKEHKLETFFRDKGYPIPINESICKLDHFNEMKIEFENSFISKDASTPTTQYMTWRLLSFLHRLVPKLISPIKAGNSWAAYAMNWSDIIEEYKHRTNIYENIDKVIYEWFLTYCLLYNIGTYSPLKAWTRAAYFVIKGGRFLVAEPLVTTWAECKKSYWLNSWAIRMVSKKYNTENGFIRCWTFPKLPIN